MPVSLRIPPATVRRLWLDLNITVNEAAAQLGITRQGLSDMARRLGLPPRAKRGAPRKGSDAEFKAMWLAGVRQDEMAAYFGYASWRGVCHRRKSMGLPTRTRTKGTGTAKHHWDQTITLAEYRRQQAMAQILAAAAAERRAVRGHWKGEAA